MNFNLVDLVRDYLNDSRISKISSAIESDIILTESALNGAIPSLLASFHELSSKPSTTGTAFKTVSNQNGGILKSFDEVLSTHNHVQLASTGNNILTSSLGSTVTNQLVGSISNLSGMSKTSASSLLGLITPVTLSLLKLKLLDSGEFNATSLTAMLDSQSNNIEATMPSELSTFYKPNHTNVDKNVNKTPDNTSTADRHSLHQTQKGTLGNGQNNDLPEKEYPNNPSFWLTKVLPLLLFTGVLYLAFNIMFSKDYSNHTQSVTNAASTSLTRVQTPLSRNRSSSYETKIHQNMQPISQPTKTDSATVSHSLINNTLKNNTQNPTQSNVPIDIAQNLYSELQHLLNHVAGTLDQIRDISSAKVAVREIRKVSARIDELTKVAKTMAEPVKKRLETLIHSHIPRLQALTRNVNNIPNVGAVIKPSIQELSASLTNFL